MTTRIGLDYGHGQGVAHNRGGVLFNEGDNNFDFGKLLKLELEKYADVKVYETRPNKADNPHNDRRADMLSKYNLDFYLSVHSNAFREPTATGVEAWQRTDDPNPSNILLHRMVNKVSKILDIPNRGVRTGYYRVLQRSNTAEIKALIELFFHTNVSDSKKYLEKKLELARELAKTIAEYFDLEKKPVTISSTGFTTGLYRVTVNKVNIRQLPTKYSLLKGSITDKGAYTITEIKNNWGRLKSGIGWIYLKGFAELVKEDKSKTIKEIAKEVYLGKWGNGEERKRKLISAGYDYSEVQKEVQKLI